MVPITARQPEEAWRGEDLMEQARRKGRAAAATLGASALFAFSPVSLVFATVVEVLPKTGLFTFVLPLLVSIFIGLLSEELFDVITRVFLTCIFFAIEMLLVLNLPVLVGVITRGVDLWLIASLSITFRLALFAAPSILLGSFLGVIVRELAFT